MVVLGVVSGKLAKQCSSTIQAWEGIMTRIIFAVLSAFFALFPNSGMCQNSPVDPHLQLFEKYRTFFQNLGLEIESNRIQEMAQDFTFSSLKVQPDSNGPEVVKLIPGENSSGNEMLFAVVPVLDSDCNISPFWKKVCRDISGAGLIIGPPGYRPLIILRDVPVDFWRMTELAYSMVFLEEVPDFKCPEGTNQKQAEFLEFQTKKDEADKLLKELTEIAVKKGLLR